MMITLPACHVAFILLALARGPGAVRPVQHGQVSQAPLLSTGVDKAFEAFIQQFGRKYTTKEYQMRREQFERTYDIVNRHNSKADRLWTAGITDFADFTAEEVAALNGWKGNHASGSSPSSFLATFSIEGKPLPADVSYSHLWTSQPRQVERQGMCGCCWAAASVSLLEAHMEIYKNKRVHFSLGEITNCVQNPYKCGGTGGCDGATVEIAMQYAMVNGVQFFNEPETVDPSMWKGTCKKEPAGDTIVPAAGDPHGWAPGVRKYHGNRVPLFYKWERLPENNYDAVLRALVEIGPLAAGIATGDRNGGASLYEYAGGIFNGCGGNAIVEHAVLVIGYGGVIVKGTATKYWLLQNSWGSVYGENGLVRLIREPGGVSEQELCQMDKKPMLGVGCQDGPKEVKVCGSCGILYDTVVPDFNATSLSVTATVRVAMAIIGLRLVL